MEENQKSSKSLIIAVVAVVAVIAILAIVYFVASPKTGAAGAKSITLEVIDDQGSETAYSVNTDAAYLSEAFDDIAGLTVEGDESEYGLYINTVNGLTADYDADGAYWAIMVNGEYGMYGADSQPVADGDDFELVYTVYEAAE